MEKAPIKKFAVEARRKLIADVTFQLERYGITEKGIVEPQTSTDKELVFDLGNGNTQTIKGERYVNQYKNLVAHVRGFYADGSPKQQLEQFIEEIAFTWFNRLIAIRFMEVNRYIPVRVLSSEIEGQKLPDLVASPFSGDLEFTDAEKQEIFDLQDANKEDDLFRFLFFRQCNALNRILPRLFEDLDGSKSFSELLVALSFNDPNGVVYHLVDDVEEPWFDIHATGQVQIIGWMYQYYNTEPKEKVFADLKKNIKISKQNIPAATQLFTPDWIVRYMVENSLGRLWYEGHPGFDKSEWKYYLDEAPQEPQVEQQLKDIRAQYAKMEPEQLKVIDPCMGSGHILCYLFDVLMQIYLDNGYSKREAVRSILENNLFGLDIDKRAAQIAYFSVMMKAREYDSNFFSRSNIPQPRVYDIQESNWLGGAYKHEMGNFLNSQQHRDTLNYLLDAFVDAKEYGSILQIKPLDYEGLKEAWETSAAATAHDVNMAMWYDAAKDAVAQLIEQAIMLSQKYDAVVTNPPYMGLRNMSKELFNYVMTNHKNEKQDLFGVFIKKCMEELCAPSGKVAMITQHVWMFISGFEHLRTDIYNTKCIDSLIHLGTRAFDEIGGEVVQTCAFVFTNTNVDSYIGRYCRLVNYLSAAEKEKAFINHKDIYCASSKNFLVLPGEPLCYWLSENVIDVFKSNPLVGEMSRTRQGLKTSDDKRFIRYFYEVGSEKIAQDIHSVEEAATSSKKWFWLNKGGQVKWYGNNLYLINWENDGKEVKDFATKVAGSYSKNITAIDAYFKSCISWPQISISHPSFRYIPSGFIFASAGPSLFVNDESKKWYVMGLLNSCVTQNILDAINPTINFGVSDILKVPFVESKQNEEAVNKLVLTNIDEMRADWDSFETSWDFTGHPLIKAITKYPSMMERGNIYLAECYDIWAAECEERFDRLKANEEELNRIFIDIYGLQDELTPEVEDKDVTVRKADLQRDVKSLLSYAVGCLFGRYAPETDGLLYAGGAWDESRYHLIHPVRDNVLPLCDEEYFGENDLVNRVVEFIKEVFGASSLEDNLAFIAKALGNKGNTSREIIRNYFLKDFYADHCKIYQKRPIYWMFDSGKKNGFKALVYLHRWDADTTGRVYNNYLSPLLRTYAQQIEQEKNVYANSKDARASSLAQKRIDKLTLQHNECKTYEKDIAHLAALRITLDLDDGVKVNYVKAQTAADGKNLNVLVPIK